MAIDWIGFGYAALVVSGGIVGFIKAGKLGIKGLLKFAEKFPCRLVAPLFMGILQRR